MTCTAHHPVAGGIGNHQTDPAAFVSSLTGRRRP